jgi:hypothetical protein
MLKAYTYKLSEEQLTLLQNAFSEAYGEGFVTLEELSDTNIKSKVHLSGRDTSVIGVFLNESSNIEKENEKVLVLGSTNTLITHLNETLDLSIPLIEEPIKEEITEVPNNKVEELEKAIKAKESVILNYQRIITELQEQLEEYSVSSCNTVDNSEYEKLKRDYANLRDILLVKENSLERLNNEYLSLQSRVNDQSILINSLERKLEETKDSSNISESDYNELKENYNNAQLTITQLNSERIEMINKISSLEKLNTAKEDTLDLMTRLGKAERIADEYLSSPFGELYSVSESNGVFFLKNSLPKYNNIKFVFTVNQGYEKEFYRLLLGSIVLDQSNGYVFVDAVNSSFADYVFGIKQVKSALDWFENGGGIRQYLSDSSYSNLKALIPTLGYLNDGYFLTVDWENRLKELNKFGKPVIVYAGNLSTMVGKYLFSLFNSSSNDTKVFIQGSLVFVRNGFSQVTGVQGYELSDICVFGLNKGAEPLLRAFKSKVNYRVLSKANDLILRG